MSEKLAVEATRALFDVLPQHRWILLRQTTDKQLGVAKSTGLWWNDVDKLLVCAKMLVDGRKGVEVDVDALSNVFGPNSSLRHATKSSIVYVCRGEPQYKSPTAQSKVKRLSKLPCASLSKELREKVKRCCDFLQIKRLCVKRPNAHHQSAQGKLCSK